MAGHDVSLYLLELLENAVRAGARRIVTTLEADEAQDRLTLLVEDDGSGLKVEPEAALDPFYTTKRGKKTGLGLSLFALAAEQAQGGLEIGRASLGGVAVRVHMQHSHIDRPPLGDLAATFASMVATNPEIDFQLHFRAPEEELQLSTAELAAMLGTVGCDGLVLGQTVLSVLQSRPELMQKLDGTYHEGETQ